MLATKVFRSAQPLRSNVRRYASPPGPASTGSSNNAIYALLAGAGLLGGGYYYYRITEPKPEAHAPPSADERKTVPKPEAHAPSSADERKTVPSSPAPSASAPQKAFRGGDQGFVDLKLESVEEINHNTKKFRFALPNSDDVSGLSIASALLTKYKGPEMEKPVIRPYTPTSDEDAKGYLDFVIKVYPNGPMSEHLHAMKPDQRLDFKGPIPKYPWEANKHDHIALIAGGTGITPMYQLARAIFKNPADRTKVTLVFGNLTEADILLKPEFEDLENTYPNRFRAFYVLDRPPEGWPQGKGHITAELLKTVLPEPKEENVKIFVCGPPGLYKAVSGAKKSVAEQGELTGMLKELGYRQDQVYKF